MSKLVKDYVCFDLETTGFGKTAEIIEIGAIQVRDGVTVDTFSELVKPINRISRQVTALTGISQSDVENAPSITEVLPVFIDFIGDDILLGHNIASFDIPILRRNVAVELKRKFDVYYIDTLYLSKCVHDVPDNKLQTMLDHYGIENRRAHRAFEDCEATSSLFQALVADGIIPDIKFSCSCTSVEEYQPVPPKEHIDVQMSDCRLDSVNGLRIVLTGDFEYGSRSDVEAALVERGAKIRSAVTAKTDYLIVGDHGSDRWKFDNGGGKIRQAQSLGVKIIPEKAIHSLLNMEVHNARPIHPF